ncbi:MAG: hypothetical protein ACTTI3_07310, partial [Treponema sp.]
YILTILGTAANFSFGGEHCSPVSLRFMCGVFHKSLIYKDLWKTRYQLKADEASAKNPTRFLQLAMRAVC